MSVSDTCATLMSPDLFLCVFYKRDEECIRQVLRCFLAELVKEYEECDGLIRINEKLPLVGLRALFVLLMPVDTRLRYWAMQYETRSMSRAPPAKVCVFLCTLRDSIVFSWMSDEVSESLCYSCVCERDCMNLNSGCCTVARACKNQQRKTAAEVIFLLLCCNVPLEKNSG
jgi:hypothetical protein